MLFKLSIKNIRKSIRDYAIYFVTLVLGVAVFYIFNAIEAQTSFLMVSDSTADALKLMVQVITGLSVFIAFVLGFLIVYASRFLMKRRNREFALYMILGMRKGAIAAILSIESIAIGILSLAAGLLIGIGASQLMSTLVAQLFEADMTHFAFTFSSSAFFKTILYFGIIMLVVVIFDLIMVGRAKLINLLQTGSRAEKVKMKNPVLCVVFFLLGAGILAYAYWNVTSGLEKLVQIQAILLPIFMGMVGTFLVFWSVSGFLLTIISKFKKTYYKGLNTFTFRQLSSRVNTMVVSISVICVMLFFTISILSAAFSMRTSLNKNIRELTPVDVDMDKHMLSEEFEQVLAEDFPDEAEREAARAIYAMSIDDVLQKEGEDLDKLLGDYITVYYYDSADFTMEDAFGSLVDEVRKDHPYLGYDSRQRLMTDEDYNRVAEAFGLEKIELASDEYAIVNNADVSAPVWNRVLSNGEEITVFGHTLHPKYPNVVNGFTRLAATQEETGLFIISKEATDPAHRYLEQVLGNYNVADDKERQAAEAHLQEIAQRIREKEAFPFLRMNTREDIRSSAVGLGAVVTFLGLYLGFVFLISGAAILALKALSDSIDSTGRYHMLRQLGAEEKSLNASLFKQQGLLFLFPLILAIVHSVFGIRFTAMLFNALGVQHTIQSMALTAAVLIVIYVGYFLVTYLSSKRIIKEAP